MNIRLAFPLLLALLLPLAASAASIVAWDVPTMTLRSSAVVEARVESVTTERGRDGSLQTRNTLKVESWLAGSGPDRLDVLQFGGTWEGREQRLVGDFRLRPGERAVLFLRGEGDERHATLLAWSVFHVEGKGDEAAVVRDTTGLSTFVPGSDARLVPVDPEVSPAPRTLRELRAAVRGTDR